MPRSPAVDLALEVTEPLDGQERPLQAVRGVVDLPRTGGVAVGDEVVRELAEVAVGDPLGERGQSDPLALQAGVGGRRHRSAARADGRSSVDLRALNHRIDGLDHGVREALLDLVDRDQHL
jgi:hypothetical protein